MLPAALMLVASGCPESTHPDAQTPVDATPATDVPSPVDSAMDVFDAPDADAAETATDVPAADVQPGAAWCSLGTDVPGVTVPSGFCVRRFGTLPEARVLLFTPNGDLLVASPSESAPGGANGGLAGVAVMTDDNHDGVADTYGAGAQHQMFVQHVIDAHGLALGGGFLYFTTQNTVFRTAYATGQRGETTSTREDLHSPAAYGSGGRWTHGLARSVGGMLYTSTGQYGACGPDGSSVGNITLIGPGTSTTVETGFRNPMYLRCHFRDEVCLANELGEDQAPGAREKIVVVHTGNDYGYPCCYTTGVSVSGAPTGRCASIAPESVEFQIGNTPFGLDWERGTWPAPFANALFVALHGSFYTSPAWQGAGIVYLPTDPTTHVPSGTPTTFVDGFGPGGSMLERPSDVTFSPDGRMFFSDDIGGAVYWVAPTTLHIPASG